MAPGGANRPAVIVVQRSPGTLGVPPSMQQLTAANMQLQGATGNRQQFELLEQTESLLHVPFLQASFRPALSGSFRRRAESPW